MRSRRTDLIALLLLLCAASPAAAEPSASQPAAADARTVRARELFVKGAALARQRLWRDAVEAFEESAALREHAGTSFNIGVCERALGRATRARKALANALVMQSRSSGQELTPAVQSEAEHYLREAEGRIARALVIVDPADAALAVDGRPLETIVAAGPRPVLAAGTRGPGPGEGVPAATVEILLDPGPHVFVLSRPGVPDTVVSESFAPGARRELKLKLALPASQPRSDGWAERRARRALAWTLVVGSVGVAALATGAGFGLWARSTWADAKAACPGLVTCPDDRGAQLSRDARFRGNFATASFVVGGAAVAGAAAIWLFARPRAEARRLVLVPAPTGALLVGLLP